MESPDKNKIKDQIQHRGNGNKGKGSFGVSHTAQDRTDKVISIYEHRSNDICLSHLVIISAMLPSILHCIPKYHCGTITF